VAAEFHGRNVLVAGAGVTGRSTVAALVELGATVTVTDGRPEALADFGPLAAPGLTSPPPGTDLVVTSPGWKPTSPLLVAARSAGIEVIGEVELAWRVSQRLSQQSGRSQTWLAVTGTDGKTTTVGMLESILLAAGLKAVACGNVGLPVIDAVRAGYDVLAVELSSYQLYWQDSMEPHAAVVLNLAEDHLEWHGSMEEYAAAKAKIYRGAKTRVLNADDEWSVRLAGTGVGFTVHTPAENRFGVVDDWLIDQSPQTHPMPESQAQAALESQATLESQVTPGSSAMLAGQAGAQSQATLESQATPGSQVTPENSAMLASQAGAQSQAASESQATPGSQAAPQDKATRENPAETQENEPPPAETPAEPPRPTPQEQPPPSPGGVPAPVYREATAGPGRVRELWTGRGLVDNSGAERLCPVDEVRPPGMHNISNALAAAALARTCGVSAEAIREGLRNYQPQPHRVQLVGEIDGVQYVNDSKATNNHAAAGSLSAYDSIVWIAGGLLHGAEVDDLVASAAVRLRGVVLLGADQEVFAQALRRHAPEVPVKRLDSRDDGAMTAAVRAARDLARPGDVVLLAPAAKSHDMFTSYVHRGEAFTKAVQASA
jgi:UDP-N-acetylmuramoylalanine-D-glutamate ligase